jgi:iron complex transport system ATP-binding protein
MNYELKSLSFSYPRREVLHGVRFSLEEGDCCAVIGPNGSGKSTLLRCMGRLLPVSCGCVWMGGEDVARMTRRELARTVAYVPQREEALPDVTVMDAVMLGRRPHLGAGLPAGLGRLGVAVSERDLTVAADALRQVDLLELALQPLRALSGGQQQRVAVARALCQQPRLLLMDEPTANLDLPHQAALMGHLRSLAAGGLTVVIALHDLSLAARFCNRFVLMSEGAVRWMGGREVVTEENLSALFDFPIGVREEVDGWFIGARF